MYKEPVIVPSVKSSIKGFASTVKSAAELKLEAEARDAANPSTTGIRGVSPSTVGIQSSEPHARSAQRRAKSETVKGEKFTGKQLKGAVSDWVQSAKVTQGALDEGLKALKLAQDTGNDDIAAMLESACQMLVDRLNEIMARGVELADMVKDETSNNPTPGLSEFHGKAAGVPEDDCPANQTGGVNGAGMDSGSTAVMDHLGKVSPVEPDTFKNPHVIDMGRMEATRKRANAIVAARNPERVRIGMDDDPLTSYDQLSFMQPAAK